MLIKKYFTLVILFVSVLSGNSQQSCRQQKRLSVPEQTPILPGACQMDEYLPLLKGKKVGLVAIPASMVFDTHLVDTLIYTGVQIVKIFGPEHGFRGNQPDGKTIENANDLKTGIPVISLYGTHKKPAKADLADIDVVLFDIQDVGARFFTYISTLAYMMEACAENNIPLIVTDRPNPNGFYVDGPVLENGFSSFVGMHPVPIVYGMSIGEYAMMVNGEKWLKGGISCNLTIVKNKNYTHSSRYQLPQRPSPNLQTMNAIYLYPSLCLFEGTVVSVGRGTENPFTVIGHPKYLTGSYDFTPHPIKGVSENPPLNGQVCHGSNLREASGIIKEKGGIELFWLIEMHKALGKQTDFFNSNFDKLAGNSTLREQITKGLSEEDIRKSWQPALENFKETRKKYLLYEDFE